MRATVASLLALAALLTGCGSGGRAEQAAQTCAKAVDEKLAGKSYEFSAADLAKSAQAETGDVMHVTSTVVFDKGLATQYVQVLDCRVRFENGKPPSVIFMQFNWSLNDLKKDSG